MSAKNQIGILISAVGSILAVTIYNAIRGTDIAPLAAAAIGIGANVLFVTFSVQWLLDNAMRYGPYRRLFDSRAQYEGYWLHTVAGLHERPYEISTISYNPESARYIYSGRSLSRNFEVVADWGSTQVEVDSFDSRIRFMYEGSILSGSDVIGGFGYMYFDRSPSGAIVSGRGFFVEADQLAGAHHHHFTMQRITNSDILNAIPGLPQRFGRKAKIGLISNNDYSIVARQLLP